VAPGREAGQASVVPITATVDSPVRRRRVEADVKAFTSSHVGAGPSPRGEPALLRPLVRRRRGHLDAV